MVDDKSMGLEEARRRLGASPGADARALKRAFRAAVKRSHPDRVGGDGAALRDVIEAYRVLKDRTAAGPSPDVRQGAVGGRAWRIVEVDEAVLARGGRVTLEDGAAPIWLSPQARRFGVLRLDGDVLVKLRPAPTPTSPSDAKRRAFAAAWAA